VTRPVLQSIEIVEHLKQQEGGIRGFINRKGEIMDTQCNTLSGALMAKIEMRPTITQKLKRRKDCLEKELAEINKTLNLLTDNPKLQELFDAVSKVNVY